MITVSITCRRQLLPGVAAAALEGIDPVAILALDIILLGHVVPDLGMAQRPTAAIAGDFRRRHDDDFRMIHIPGLVRHAVVAPLSLPQAALGMRPAHDTSMRAKRPLNDPGRLRLWMEALPPPGNHRNWRS